MSEFDDMYNDDGLPPSRNKKPVPSTLGNFSINGKKSRYIEIDGEKIEIINPSYVDNLENELKTIKRESKSYQNRVEQLIRVVNTLSGDMNSLRRQLNARGRFD